MNNNTDVNYTLSNIEVGFGVFKVLFVSDPNIERERKFIPKRQEKISLATLTPSRENPNPC